MILEWVLVTILTLGWFGFLIWKMNKDKNLDK
jgi:hypothetical protein